MPEDRAVKHHRAMTHLFNNLFAAVDASVQDSACVLSVFQTFCMKQCPTESVMVSVMVRT